MAHTSERRGMFFHDALLLGIYCIIVHSFCLFLGLLWDLVGFWVVWMLVGKGG